MQGEDLDVWKDDDHFPRDASQVDFRNDIHLDRLQEGRNFQEVEQARDTKVLRWEWQQLERGEVWKDKVAQGGKPRGREIESLQVDRTSEEAKRGRDLTRASARIEELLRCDFEGAEEWELAGIAFRERYNVLPVAFREFEVYNLLGARGNQCYGANRSNGMGDDIQCRPFARSRRVDTLLAFSEEQL